MPLLFKIMRNSDDELRGSLFDMLKGLVYSLRQHLRKYLDDMIQLVREFWQRTPELQAKILILLGALSGTCLATSALDWGGGGGMSLGGMSVFGGRAKFWQGL